MIDREGCLEELRQNEDLLINRFNVHSMRLFGSVARNEQTDGSDVDVLVDMEPNLFAQIELKQYLEQLLGCNVDVIRHHRNMDTFFLKQIERDGITVFS